MLKRKRDLLLLFGMIVLVIILYLAIKHQYVFSRFQPNISSLEHLIRIKLVVSLVVFSVITFVALFYIPIKLARVNRYAYMKETLFCTFASLVYFGVDQFLKYLDNAFTLSYVLVIYLAASIIFSILLLYISRTVTEKSAKYRTALAGSISGGILFGLLIEVIKRAKMLL